MESNIRYIVESKCYCTGTIIMYGVFSVTYNTCFKVINPTYVQEELDTGRRRPHC